MAEREDVVEFTGERYVPGVDDPALAYEHVHRYLWAAELAAERSVLDIACGTGYGSRILASRAARVVGMDVSAEAVAHARAHYAAPNLEFQQGACEDFTLEAPVDLVVSFETLEHFRDHERFLDRVVATLRPGGGLVLSTPNRAALELYGARANPFHERELEPAELLDLLGGRFRHVRLLGQRLLTGSFIMPFEGERMWFGPKASFHAIEEDDLAGGGVPAATRSPGEGRLRLLPIYLIAIASDDARFAETQAARSDFLADNAESLWRRLNRLTGLERQLGRWLADTGGDEGSPARRAGSWLECVGEMLERLERIEEEVSELGVRDAERARRLGGLEGEMVRQAGRSGEGLRRTGQLEEEMLAQIRAREGLEALLAARLARLEVELEIGSAATTCAPGRLERLEREGAAQTSAQMELAARLGEQAAAVVGHGDEVAALGRRLQEAWERLDALSRGVANRSDEVSQLQRRAALLESDPAARLLRRAVGVLAGLEARIVGAVRPLVPSGMWSLLRRRRAAILGLPSETSRATGSVAAAVAGVTLAPVRVEPYLVHRDPPVPPALTCWVRPLSDSARVSTWLGFQTLPRTHLEVLELPASAEKGIPGAQVGGPRPEPRGRYVTVVGEEHARLPVTALETALVALETEGLLFTSLPVLGGGSLTVWRRDAVAGEASGGGPALLAEAVAGGASVAGRVLAEPAAVASATAVAAAWEPPPIPGRGVLRIGRQVVSLPAGEALPAVVRQPVSTPEDLLVDAAERHADDGPCALVLLPFMAIGGAEVLTAQVLERLAGRCRFVVVAVEPAADALGTTADLFRRVTPYVYFPGENAPPQLVYGHVARLLRRFRADALFAANGANWLYDALSTLRASFPGLRISNQLFDHREGWIRRYDRAVVEAVDVHVAVNGHIRRALVEEHGVPPAKVRLIPHGIDLREFDSARFDRASVVARRRRLGIPDGKTVVAFLGRLHPQKRPLDFLALAKRLEADPRHHFLMVGDGPIAGTVDRFQALYAMPNLTRLPFYRPFDELLSLVDVLCVSSEYEGLPLVVLNALAMGIPVLSTDVGSIAEVVSDGVTGAIVPVGDLDALTAGLFRVADPEFRARAAEPARATVAQGFDIDRAAEVYAGAIFGEEAFGPSTSGAGVAEGLLSGGETR